MEQTELKEIIAANMVKYRKAAGLTQANLAEKLNYSDKAVSKWERAEGMPDIYILSQLAEIYNITVNDLISTKIPKKAHKINTMKYLVALLSSGIVWLVATILFVTLELIPIDLSKSWLSFIYAIPISCIVLVVFSAVWRNNLYVVISSSFLVWTAALSGFLTVSFQKSWMLFILAIPLQGLFVLWFFLKKQQHKLK